MIKRTPQEIADFFGAYVAMDRDEDWYLYPSKPKRDILDGWWVDEEKSLINISNLVKIDKTPNWKESLCEPREDCDPSVEELMTSPRIIHGKSANEEEGK